MSNGYENGPQPTAAALAQGADAGEVAWERPDAGRAATAAGASALGSRVFWFFLFIVPTAVLATAALLSPDPAGHGTHTQLGLPPCGFLVVTGVPCPGCGLTTSFSHMVRLDVVGAAQANPFGIALFLVTAVTAVVSLLGMIRGWPVVRTLDRLQADKVAMGLAVASVTVWIVKIATLWIG